MALTKKEKEVLTMACGSYQGINDGKPIGYSARNPKDYDRAIELLASLNIRYTEQDHSNSVNVFNIIIKQAI